MGHTRGNRFDKDLWAWQSLIAAAVVLVFVVGPAFTLRWMAGSERELEAGYATSVLYQLAEPDAGRRNYTWLQTFLGEADLNVLHATGTEGSEWFAYSMNPDRLAKLAADVASRSSGGWIDPVGSSPIDLDGPHPKWVDEISQLRAAEVLHLEQGGATYTLILSRADARLCVRQSRD